MLRGLDIKNVAVIEKLSIELKPGMTVLTGETGAGKSIIIDSINMLLGARANKSLIRNGEEKAFVSASFDADDATVKLLEEYGVDCDDDFLIISRELNSDGKSVARINGQMVPSAVLKEISSELVNIHGQQDNQAILNSAKHIDFLDDYAGVCDELAEYKRVRAELKGIGTELEKSRMNEDEKLRLSDLLRYQTDEIEKAELSIGEKEKLTEERTLIQNSAKIAEGVNAAYNALFETESGSAYDAVSVAGRALDNIAGFNGELSELSSKLVDIKYAIEDVVHELRAMELDFDERYLDDIEERLDTISKLEKKYGGSVEAVLEFYEKASKELEDIVNNDEVIKRLEAEYAKKEAELKKIGEALFEKRRSAAETLSKSVVSELSDLDMEKARFEVNLDHTDEFFKNGMDKAEFLITTNPGEPLKALTKVASGGELSRVMLAIKTILSGRGTSETLIFDEIDTGVSGRAAQKIASKLWELGERAQVICISHQPQLAAFSDNHLYIEKTVTDESAKTTVRELSDEERVFEVARITDGADITESARVHASEMIELARSKKGRKA